MFVSPKKKGSSALWIACLLLLLDVRVFFGVIAAFVNPDLYATSVEELPLELKHFVSFTDGKITVEIKGSDSLPNIPLITDSSSTLSFRASLKGCPDAKQTWNFVYPTEGGNVSLIWNPTSFYFDKAGALANQNELVDVALEKGEAKVKKAKNEEADKQDGIKTIGAVNAHSLPEGGYDMSISVSPTSVGDGCVLTLEFDKEKFRLRKSTTPTSTAKPAPAITTPSNEKAGMLWIIIGAVVIVFLIIAVGIGIFCCMKRRRRNTGSKAGPSERGDEFTCVSQTVAQRSEESKANKVAAISAITENKDDLKAANERVAIKPKTPKEASTQKSHVSSMSTKMVQESQVDGAKVNSAA